MGKAGAEIPEVTKGTDDGSSHEPLVLNDALKLAAHTSTSLLRLERGEHQIGDSTDTRH